jgi:hypothetical protein
MKNTVMTYKYTDRFGYSTANSIVFSGQIDATGKNKLISFLKDGYFIPSAVGLPNLQGDIQQYDIIRVCNNICDYEPYGDEGPDHVWHSLDIEDICASASSITDVRSIHDMVDLFDSINRNWDEEGTLNELKQLKIA